MTSLNKYRILTLTYPYEMMSDKTVSNYLGQILALKIRGYQEEYPNGVLPIDTSDFIALHHIVCLELKNELRPIMGFKTTPYSRCEKHRIPFPALSLASQAGAPKHYQALEKIMARCLLEKKELAYASSWTIDPIFRKDKGSSLELRGLFETLYILGHKDYNIDEMILGGTLRFKTEVMFAKMGHNPLVDENEQPLPSIHVKHLFGEEVLVMHAKKFTPYADECCIKFQDMWNNRIEISPTSADKTLKKLLVA